MRLWHWVLAVAAVSVLLAAGRDPVARVMMVVFATGLGEVVLGTTSVLALFQTVGALGEARGVGQHVEAIAATSVVLVLATALMSTWLLAGAWIVTLTV